MPSILSGTFQSGSHEICGSVAALVLAAVVTTSMASICSGRPVFENDNLEPAASSLVPPAGSRST